MATKKKIITRYWPAFGQRLGSLLLIFASTLLLASVWLITTTSGAKTVFSVLQLITNGKLYTAEINGRLLGTLSIGKLIIKNQQGIFDAEKIALQWNALDLTAGLLHINRLKIGSLKVQLENTADQAVNMPQSLYFPLRLQIDNLNLEHGSIEKGKNNTLIFDDIAIRLDFDGQLYALKLNKLLLHTPKILKWNSQLQGYIHVHALPPFETKTELNLIVLKEKIDTQAVKAEIKVTAIGNLSNLKTEYQIKIENEKLKMSANGDVFINPYSHNFLNNGKIFFHEINLNGINRDWPITKINAEIKIDKNRNGDFYIKNILPGTINHGHLPFYRADGKFQIHTHQIQILESKINDGILRIRGDFSSTYANFFINSQRLNLKTIDSRLAKTSLFADLDFKGKINSIPEAYIKFQLGKSTINAHALSGQGIFIIADKKIKIEKLNLSAGNNSIHVHGIIDKKKGDLQLAIVAPDLAQLGQNFHGDANIKAHLKGNIENQFVEIDWDINNLLIPGNFRVGHTKGIGKLNINKNSEFLITRITANFIANKLNFQNLMIENLNLRANINLLKNSNIELNFNGKNLNYESILIKNIKLDANGRNDNHKITALVISEKEKLTGIFFGKLVKTNSKLTWIGILKEAQADGFVNAKLKKDAQITISAESINFEAFAIDSNFGYYLIEYFKINQYYLASKGNFQQAQLVNFLGFFKSKNHIKKTDILINGDWLFEFDKKKHEQPQINLNIRRTSGDIIFEGDKQFSAGLTKIHASIKTESKKFSINIDAEGNHLGIITINANTIFEKDKYFPDFNTPINAKLKIDIKSIAWAEKFIASDLIIDGSINAELIIAGSLNKPKFYGHINGNRLRAMSTYNGINLKSGILDCQFSDDIISIKQLRFESSSGSVMASGPIRIHAGKFEAELLWIADKFLVFNSPDKKLGVTGSGKIIARDSQLRINGNLIIDHGFFDIGRAETPKLSNDVIISNQHRKKAQAPAVNLNIGIGLGQNLILDGRGLKAKISGALKLLSNEEGSVSVFGLMQIIKGSYQAYGRELTIERGMLRFDGSPSNPAIDILAMRRGTEVEAGVAIAGNAIAPYISLVSEPQVPDAEKLSWLVLGQRLYNASGTQALELQNAATSLLAQSAATGVQSQIGSAFGLDSISISKSKDTLHERIVTLGKRLSSRLYVSYQQGLQTASSVLVFSYALSSRLSLETETGSRSVFSLFYNINFD